MMSVEDALRVLDALEAADVRAWVEGGWGIDALAGRQTRDHDDLDLAVDARREGFDRAVTALAAIGYERGADDLPIRLVVDASGGRSVDLHPIRLQLDGSALQAGHDRDYLYPANCFTLGRIGDRDVPCLSAAIQREFHSFYEPRDVDHHDLALLGDMVDDPVGVVVISGVPGAGKTTVAGSLARRFRAGVHVEADRLQDMVVAGGRWAEEPPFTEAERQLRIRTRLSAALADVWCHAGFVPVIDDIYVSRGRLDLLVASLAARPVRLVVLAPDPSAALARDAARPDKTVGDRWVHLDAVQREELAGVGLWIDSSQLTGAETVDVILDRLDDALLMPEAAT